MGMGFPIPTGMGIRLQFRKGNGKEWEIPQMEMGMTHLPTGKIPTRVFSRAVSQQTGHQSLRNINTGISVISTVMK